MLFGGPGSATVHQGFSFENKTVLISISSFFAPSRLWKVLGEVWESVRRPGWPPRRSLERSGVPQRSPREAKHDLWIWGPREGQVGTSVEQVAFGNRGTTELGMLFATGAKHETLFFEYLL